VLREDQRTRNANPQHLSGVARSRAPGVEDTGQGIAAADLSSIFEPFWRGDDSSGEGFGIGLALVRGIVELHDGAISVFSDGPGKGTRFSVTLPISAS
jgi:signal transduction histidine kinase